MSIQRYEIARPLIQGKYFQTNQFFIGFDHQLNNQWKAEIDSFLMIMLLFIASQKKLVFLKYATKHIFLSYANMQEFVTL